MWGLGVNTSSPHPPPSVWADAALPASPPSFSYNTYDYLGKVEEEAGTVSQHQHRQNFGVVNLLPLLVFL